MFAAKCASLLAAVDSLRSPIQNAVWRSLRAKANGSTRDSTAKSQSSAGALRSWMPSSMRSSLSTRSETGENWDCALWLFALIVFVIFITHTVLKYKFYPKLIWICKLIDLNFLALLKIRFSMKSYVWKFSKKHEIWKLFFENKWISYFNHNKWEHFIFKWCWTSFFIFFFSK